MSCLALVISGHLSDMATNAIIEQSKVNGGYTLSIMMTGATHQLSNYDYEDFFNEINSLGPFGSGNSEPKFLIENIKVISSNIIGNNHIKSILSGKDGSTFKAFAWNAKNTPLETFLINKKKKIINIAGKIRLNEWKGNKKVEFIIEDISIN